MRIVCIGGGPAGLYFALLMKQSQPATEITVVERNRPNETFGWGVVFSDQTLGNLAQADPVSYEAICQSFYHWDEIDVHFKERTITSGGHGFCGIARKRLLNILQERCERLGVELVFQTEVAKHVNLLGRFDALGHSVETEGVRQVDHRLDDGAVLGISAQSGDERLVDLQGVDRESLEVAE